MPMSVKFFADLGNLLVDASTMAKSKSVWEALALVPEILAVVADAKGALPELAHLNKDEAMQVAEAAYDCIKKVVAAA